MKETELNKQKLKTLRQLKAAGIDTRKKLEKLTGREMFENSIIRPEMGNIFELQDALKMRKEYDWIMDGIDPNQVSKEKQSNADDDRKEGATLPSETYEGAGY